MKEIQRKEQIYNRMVNQYLHDISSDPMNLEKRATGYDLYCIGSELQMKESSLLAKFLLEFHMAPLEQYQDLNQSYNRIVSRYLREQTMMNNQRWLRGYDLYCLGYELQMEEVTILAEYLLNHRVMTMSPDEKMYIEEFCAIIRESIEQISNQR